MTMITDETTVQSCGVRPPEWIADRDITVGDLRAIAQGGCASGAYMPAVTYHLANATMGVHGDDVLEYIEETQGELPKVPDGISWSGMAVFYLSIAVEAWAYDTLASLGLEAE